MPAKVLHVISAYDIFGAEKNVIREVELLSRSGIDSMVALIQKDPRCPFVDKIEKMGIPYRHFVSRSRFDLTPAVSIRDFIEEWRCDIVHSHKYKADIISLMAARRSSIPVVSTAHGWCSEDLKARFYETMQAISWNFFDKLICVCESYKKLIRCYGVPEERIIVNHNGIIADDYLLTDPAATRSGFRKKYGIPEGHFAAGIIGRLSVEKGHRFFIEAAVRVLKTEKNTIFVIIGSGLEDAALRGMIRDYGIESNVRLIGYVDDMRTVYSGLDAVVMPSLREGLPNTLLEAMIFEKPVIASRVGGIPEVVENGVDGILVPPMDVGAIYTALVGLIRDPSLRGSLGRRAREKVLAKFDFRKRTERMIRIYDDLIAKRRSP